MALRVRRRQDIAERYARRASQASGDYVDGALTTPNSWAKGAVAAQGNYEAGVTAAIAEKRFARGVAAAGDGKWQAGVQAKGAARYAQGVSQAQDAYATSVEPYLNVLEKLDPGPRGPRGSEQNYQRAINVGKALNEEKKRRMRGGV